MVAIQAGESQGGGLLGKLFSDFVAGGALAVLSHLAVNDIWLALVKTVLEHSESEAWRHHDGAGCFVHIPVREGTSLPGVGLDILLGASRHSRGASAAILAHPESRWCHAVSIEDKLLRLAVGLEHLTGHHLEGILGNLGGGVLDGTMSPIVDIILEASSLALAKVGLDIEDILVEIVDLSVELKEVLLESLNLLTQGTRLRNFLTFLSEASGEEACDSNVGFHL